MVKEKSIKLILSYHQRVSRLKNIIGKLKTYMSKAEQYGLSPDTEQADKNAKNCKEQKDMEERQP
jgi:hypothetical protein